jgi:hypothetical protein
VNQLIKNSIDFEQKWGKDHFSLSICRQEEVVDNLGPANLGDQAPSQYGFEFQRELTAA